MRRKDRERNACLSKEDQETISLPISTGFGDRAPDSVIFPSVHISPLDGRNVTKNGPYRRHQRATVDLRCGCRDDNRDLKRLAVFASATVLLISSCRSVDPTPTQGPLADRPSTNGFTGVEKWQVGHADRSSNCLMHGMQTSKTRDDPVAWTDALNLMKPCILFSTRAIEILASEKMAAQGQN